MSGKYVYGCCPFFVHKQEKNRLAQKNILFFICEVLFLHIQTAIN